jgi:hypothetical protein
VDYWFCRIVVSRWGLHRGAMSYWHPSGTAKMGQDHYAVIDGRLKVDPHTVGLTASTQLAARFADHQWDHSFGQGLVVAVIGVNLH